MKNPFLAIKHKAIKMTGEITLTPYPCWMNYKMRQHKVNGKEVREVLSAIWEGDILLRRFDGYLNTIFTPGFYGHAAISVKGNDVAHAVSKGVCLEDILEFVRCDSIILLRPNDWRLKDRAVMKAMAMATCAEKIPYDFDFERTNASQYCTEFMNTVYEGVFNRYFTKFGKHSVLLPDSILRSQDFRVVYETRH